MTRYFSFLFLSLILGSVGCRMCGSPYDYCMPTYLERSEDYRGCDTLYRAGSIYQTDDCYRGYGGDVEIEDRSVNAGNFGVTVPIKSLGPTRRGAGSTIAKPPTDSLLDTGFDTPRDIEDLLRESMPGQTPLMPTPLMPTPLDNSPPPQPAPFKPSPPTPVQPPAEPMPFTMPSTNEPTITVEDLRRLDPSVTDIKIINIDDALDTAAPKGNPNR